MKWRVYLCSALFVFLGLFVGSVIINQNSVSAISDRVVTINSNTAQDICRSDCNDFTYLIIETDNLVNNQNSSFSLTFQARFLSSFSLPIMGYGQPKSVFYILPNTNYISLSTSYALSVVIDAGYSYIITLTNNSPFGSVVSGSLSITENGTYNVFSYSEVVVDVSPEIIQGDYHDDLVSINKSILICGSVCLIIYFFYCIYRMLLRGRI